MSIQILDLLAIGNAHEKNFIQLTFRIHPMKGKFPATSTLS